MIACVIYNEDDIDGFPLGGSQTSNFNFDTLPKIGDILWLCVFNKDRDNSINTGTGEIVCTVVFAARRSCNIPSPCTGYLVVRMDKEKKYGGYTKD